MMTMASVSCPVRLASPAPRSRSLLVPCRNVQRRAGARNRALCVRAAAEPKSVRQARVISSYHENLGNMFCVEIKLLHTCFRAKLLMFRAFPSLTPQEATAFAPATVANLGPGFDFLGVAVEGQGDIVTATLRPDLAGQVGIESIVGDNVRASTGRVPTRSAHHLPLHTARFCISSGRTAMQPCSTAGAAHLPHIALRTAAPPSPRRPSLSLTHAHGLRLGSSRPPRAA